MFSKRFLSASALLVGLFLNSLVGISGTGVGATSSAKPADRCLSHCTHKDRYGNHCPGVCRLLSDHDEQHECYAGHHW